MTYHYKTQGTCSSQINIDMDGDIIKNVEIIGGCNGNSKGLSAIIKGMKAEDVIKSLDGITCGMKKTSCPDQLAQALKEALQK